MESRFEAPANKEFFNGIGETQTLRRSVVNVCFGETQTFAPVTGKGGC